MASDPITLGELQHAIRDGELDLVYQPEVDLRTGHIAAVEALVRWSRPDRRVILPSDFIPVAEQSGAIHELTANVLETAIAQAARWSNARWDCSALPVWVNVSAIELGDAQLGDRISGALASSGAQPGQLGIEVTETAPIADLPIAVATLQRLHSAGIRIALDDFGTGYSSLAHLRTLPVDVIKVDRSFVTDVAHSVHDAAIVAAIVEMAHTMQRIVVAEGVEDSDQQHALDQLGCDLGQGYLFASPQPAHCLDILLAADRELASSPARSRSATIRLPLPRVSESRGVFADRSRPPPR
jgi:EAL domain-containing protein (putative c-di-GMP-specific phosphodiesterase class I)